MNFKQWLLTEELYPNKTAVVYHRTHSDKNISSILTSGFQVGEGSFYGKGLYTTFALESQFTKYMTRYGNFVVKFKVTDLDKYLICQLSVAKYILGNDYSISSQFKKFNIQETEEKTKEYDSIQNKSVYTGGLAKEIYTKHADLTSKCKGLIFRGESDGYVLVKYEPVNDATITMLGYAEADVYDDKKMNKLTQNQGWITSTDKAKIKSVYSLPSEKKADYNKAEVDHAINLILLATPATIPYLINKYASKIKDMPDNKILDLIKRSPYKDEMAEAIVNNKPNIPDSYIKSIILKLKDKSKFVEMIMNNRKEISSDLVYPLITYAKNKDKMAETILKKILELTSDDVHKLLNLVDDKDKFAELILNKKQKINHHDIAGLLGYAKSTDKIAEMIINKYPELTSDDVYTLIEYTKDQNKIAELLGSDNISKLSDGDVFNLLNSKNDKEQMAKIIIQYKKELSENNVFNLLFRANDKDQMAKILGADNINKLSDNSIFHLLYNVTDKDQIAKILGSENMNKLSYNNVFILLNKSKDIEQIAQMLGSNNISKLSDNNVRNFLENATDKDQMAKIIIQYKKELSEHDVFNLLKFSTHKHQMAKLLGVKNVSKLYDSYVRILLSNTYGKIAKTLNTYHQNKTPKIQELINKYLSYQE